MTEEDIKNGTPIMTKQNECNDPLNDVFNACLREIEKHGFRVTSKKRTVETKENSYGHMRLEFELFG